MIRKNTNFFRIEPETCALPISEKNFIVYERSKYPDIIITRETKTYLARSGVKTAGNAARVEFKNTCNVNNLRKLRITKKMNGLSTTDKFSFQVYLTGQNRQFIPYDGGYEVIHKDGTSVSKF